MLGPTTFGEYNVIQATIGMFGTVSGMGMGLAATKLIAEWHDKDVGKTSRIIGSLILLSIGISLLVSLIFFSAAPWISDYMLDNPSLSIYLRLTALIVILDALNGVQNGVLIGFGAFKKMAVINTVVGMCSAPILIGSTYFYGLAGLTLGLLLCRLINVIANSRYLGKIYREQKVKIEYKINRYVFKDIFSISVPSFLSSLSTSPVSWLSTTLFVNQPVGYAALGLYNAANQLRTLVLLLPDSAGKVTMPKLANSYGKGDASGFRKTVGITIGWNLLLSILPAVFLFFFGDFFLKILGSEFEFSNGLVATVLVAGILIAATNAIGYIFICSNLVWFDFFLRVCWGVTLLLLIFFYGRYNGATGYGLSIVGASMVHILSQGIILLYKFKKSRNE